MPMSSFLRRGGLTGEQRVDLHEYLRGVRPLAEAAEREYGAWLEAVVENQGKLRLEGDPDGHHAAVYIWRVGDYAREFVQRRPVKGAERYHETFSLCLEARAAAAELFKEATGTGSHNNPGAKLKVANEKLAESQRLSARSREELRELEGALAAR